MSEETLYPEWRKSNEATRYPFAEHATLTTTDGRVVLEGTFLDAVLHPVGGDAGLSLTSVTISHSAVTLAIGNPSVPALCTGTLALVNPEPNVKLVDAYGRPAGVLVSDTNRLSVFQSWGVGVHTFALGQSEFAATVCVPTPEVGLRGLLLDDGSLLSGEVWLVGDDGVVLRYETVAFRGSCRERPDIVRAIRVDVVGDPLFRRRLCAPQELFDTPRFIRKIRFVGPNMTFECEPDDTGDIKILGNNHDAEDTVLRVTTVAAGLTISAAGDSSLT